MADYIMSRLIILMRNLYVGQTATVRTECGSTEEFGIGKGVRQSCVLSPTLFNLYAEMVMQEADLDDMQVGVRMGGRVLNNLRYADDVTLLAETEEGLRELVERVDEAGRRVGLHLNLKKTKVMSNSSVTLFQINNVDIEVVKTFNLLGSIIEETGTCGSELAMRLALGRVAMKGLAKVWKDRGLQVETKVRLVEALVFPVATYGCES